jgi:hypothetical protein
LLLWIDVGDKVRAFFLRENVLNNPSAAARNPFRGVGHPERQSRASVGIGISSGWNRMARREVQPGQKYQQTEASSVWAVVDLTSDGEGIAHARLIRVGDSTAVKMISVSALKDPRLYKLIEE